MARKPVLPSPTQLAVLDIAKVELLIQLADHNEARDHRHDMFGMACGTASFLCCVIVFYLLVLRQHYTSAGVVLGTSVLSIIGRMLKPR